MWWNRSSLQQAVAGYQVGILLTVAVFTFVVFYPQEPISKFSGSLFDTDDKMRDRRNTRPSLQEKHKSAMKGKSNLRVQPPSSAAGCFPSESGQILEELRAVNVPQPPLKVLSCCMGWSCWWGAPHVHGEVHYLMWSGLWEMQRRGDTAW